MSTAKDGLKRSRWGSSTASENFVKNNDSSNVPDDVALQALLAEAEARQAQRDSDKLGSQQQKKMRKTDDARDGTNARGRKPYNKNNEGGESSYYGPSESQRQADTANDAEDTEALVDKEKPNFGVSGVLAKDLKAGNMYRGVLLKFQEPPEARAPNTLWRLYVYKGDELLETLHINRQSAYLCGRNTDIADIPLLHQSCSSQHAVIQYRAIPDPSTGKTHTQPYIMDLESANGTWLNGVPIDAARYYQLKKGDVLKFGASTREYVLLAADTRKI